MFSIVSTFDSMLKLTISPQSKRAETDPRQGIPTRAHLQPPELLLPPLIVIMTVASGVVA